MASLGAPYARSRPHALMQSHMRLFLFVESNTTGTGSIFLERACRAGLVPVFLARDPARYGFLRTWPSRWRVEIVDTTDRCALLARAREISEESDVVGVFSTSDYFIPVAAWLAQALGLPGGNPDAIASARNKRYQRDSLQRLAADLNPRHVAVATVKLAVEAGKALGHPVVVKPTLASGSVGVRLCSEPNDVAAHAEELLGTGSGISEILVEEEVVGPEFSIEIFHGQVVGITEKHLGPKPFFVEVGHTFPSRVGGVEAMALEIAAIRATRVLGLEWGPVHAEIRLSDDGPKVIEINPRLAGDYIPELIREASGLDLITACLEAAQGVTPSLQGFIAARCAAIRFLHPTRSGVLRDLPAVEAIASPYLLDWRFYRGPNEHVAVRGDYRDRIGHIVAAAISEEREAMLGWLTEQAETIMGQVYSPIPG